MKITKLNSRFYDQTALEQAIKDYAPLGKIRFKKRGIYFIISFESIKKELAKVITDEFGNYVLAQVIKNKF